jgi:hypothetical protein
MKYDTSPLSIDTSGVDLTPPEHALRFVPEEDHPDSGPISQQTVVARSVDTQVGYSTYIEPPPQTNRLNLIKCKLETPRYKTWAMTALLATFSAVAGGLSVYWVSSDRPPATQIRPRNADVEPVTEIQTAEAFVARQPADSAALEPLIPKPPEIPAHRERTLNHASRVGKADSENSANEMVSNGAIETPELAEPEQPKPEPESKVGAYVVEKPQGRRPLARCADGTYSFVASKSAACSGRGGVSEWMSGDKAPAATTPAKQAAYVLGPRGGCYYLDSSNKKVYVENKYCQ